MTRFPSRSKRSCRRTTLSAATRKSLSLVITAAIPARSRARQWHNVSASSRAVITSSQSQSPTSSTAMRLVSLSMAGGTLCSSSRTSTLVARHILLASGHASAIPRCLVRRSRRRRRSFASPCEAIAPSLTRMTRYLYMSCIRERHDASLVAILTCSQRTGRTCGTKKCTSALTSTMTDKSISSEEEKEVPGNFNTPVGTP
mmetsp:Transcript_2555/g.6945  ORF Transcript_2555/g.6945 Transcript_2555/m.6945 type:complete len:201 (-) Transcript_2555:115-717(-)